MKNSLLFLFFTGFVFQCFSQSASPEVIPSSGDYKETGTQSISWTLGEGVTETFESQGIILTQGFQQDNLVVTAIESIPDTKFEITAYPNPVSSFLILKIEAESLRKLSYSLYDIQGKLILKNRIKENETVIRLEGYLPSTYFLKVYHAGREIQSYKIIKALRE